MNAGPTASRVYDDLRSLIIHDEFLPGSHLDPIALAERLGASTTPIREALNRLTGDGLIETRQGSGFYLALPDVVTLKDLYTWTGDLAQVALRQRSAPSLTGLTIDPQRTDYADRSASLFQALARLSDNNEYRDAMTRANARLHPFRIAEPEVLTDTAQELGALETATQRGDAAVLRRLLASYVRRRSRHASMIARSRYRSHQTANKDWT